MRSNPGMANRQGDVDLREAQVDVPQLTLWLGLALPNHPSYLSAYEDGTDRVFRNVGIYNSDVMELPRRKHTTFRTRQKFEIKKDMTMLIVTFCNSGN